MNANTNWDEFFGTFAGVRPMSEGAYNEAKRRVAAARAVGKTDATCEAYVKSYEAYSKNSAKTRTQAKRRKSHE